MTPQNLRDLYVYQLRDLLSAETQLISALPTMAENASTPDLERAFRDHLEETRGHKARLEQILDRLKVDKSGHTCHGMKGLIKEAKELVDDSTRLFGKDAPHGVRDAGLIASAQRVEHYEIAGYGTVATYAEMLGRAEDHALLGQTLEEEKKADSLLTRLAKESVNTRAARA